MALLGLECRDPKLEFFRVADLALGLRSEGGVSPLAPVFLPEFEQHVSWLMCRNPMCGSFGIPFDGALPSRGAGSVGDARCRIDLVNPQFKCRACGHSFKPCSNAGIRVLARHFLAQSLPFADCPNRACENHGLSVFDHWAPTSEGRRRLYRRNRRSAVACRKCGKGFSLGKPLRLHFVEEGSRRKRPVKRLVGDVVDLAVLAKSLRQGLHFKEIGAGEYYSCLLNIAARVRDNLAWRAAQLGSPRFADARDPMRVQTDVLDVSLKRHGRGPRHQLLKLIVSVAHLPSRRTWFILAAHPAFLPEYLCPDVFEQQEDMLRHPLARRWDCLEHVLQVKKSRSLKRDKAALPDVSRKGLFADSPYAELAHFLVVRRMLRRFPVVHHCMDSAGSLRAAAVTALSGDVQSGRVEIALFQHRKKGGKSGGGTGAGGEGLAEMPASLEAARRDMEARFKERVAGQLGISGLLDDSVALARAKAFKNAFSGAYSASGDWAWLRHPTDQSQYVDARTLWLTEAPGKGWDAGRGLMRHATLQSVDSAFNSMREQVRALERPDFRAAPGRGYRGANFGVDEVMAEVVLYLLYRNYSKGAYAQNESMEPGRAMGIMRSNERRPVIRDVALNFRLDLEHAGRLSQWWRTK